MNNIIRLIFIIENRIKGAALFLLLLLISSNNLLAQRVDLSGSHGLAFCSDSSLWVWGNLIDTIALKPIQIHPTQSKTFRSITTLSGSSFAIDTLGNVWSWGINNSGQLGINSTTKQSVPGLVHGLNNIGFLSNIKSVSGKSQSVFALANDSTIWSWGSNSTGVLGDGTYFNTRRTPVKVIVATNTPLKNIVQVSSSSEHALALDANGTVWVWGRDYYGESGQALAGNYYLNAVQVKNETGLGLLSNVKAVAAGRNFSFILKNDGSLWSWGKNDYGQLGNGTIVNSTLPVRVVDTTGTGFLSNIIAIEAGDGFAMALSADGKVYLFGSNKKGQLTNSFFGSYSSKPKLIKSLPKAVKILSGSETAAIETSTGEIIIWGNNVTSNIGNNTNSQYVLNLKPVLDPNGKTAFNSIKQMSMGYDHQIALRNDGSVWAWGNHSLNIYNANEDACALPNKIYDSTGTNYLNNIKEIAAGDGHNIALSNAGIVYGWGTTSNYVLGYPTISYYYKSFALKNADGSMVRNVRSIAAGATASVFLNIDSTVTWCGRLYLNSLNSYQSVYPTKLKDTSGTKDLKSVVSVAAGFNTLYAVTADGQVWAVGHNDYGQMGVGNTSFHYGVRLMMDSTGTTPLKDIASISTKKNSIIALKKDGTLLAWGINTYGQLGVGDTTFSLQKRHVKNISGTGIIQNIKAVSMGENHCLALLNDSTAVGWGYNYYGETADNTIAQKNLPVVCKTADGSVLKNIRSVQAGSFLSSFLLHDNTALSLGYNLDGQTGTRPSFGENVPQLCQIPCRSFIPKAQFKATQTLGCINQCIQFVDSSTNFPDSWYWEVPGANPAVSTEKDPVFCFTSAGIYNVTLTSKNFKGNNTLLKTGYITILNNADANFNVTIDTIARKITTTNTSTNSNTYLWDFGNGITDTSKSPTHTYNQSKTYKVCLTTYNFCGMDSVCRLVTFNNTGIQKNENIRVSLHPNPANKTIQIAGLDFRNSTINYIITNALGQEIKQGKLDNSQIDVSTLVTGIYFLELSNGAEVFSLKFVRGE